MNKKRGLFIALLSLFFVFCYIGMSNKYDPLARYPYATDENRDIILKNLTTSAEIDYIISQKIKPEEFMPYFGIDGFNVKNTLYYNVALKTREDNKENIVNFINNYREYFNLSTLEIYLKNYDYNQLGNSFYTINNYNSDLTLIANPSKIELCINDDESIGYYIPSKLVVLSDIPNVNIVQPGSSIYVSKQVVEPLRRLKEDLSVYTNQSFGNLIVTKGYVSRDEQIKLYEQAMLTYGGDDWKKYEDIPGQSEFQLGLTVKLAMASSKVDDDLENLQTTKWIQENAHKYGFIVRYPNGKESITRKISDPFTLRYVGNKLATSMYNDSLCLEEVDE